MPYTRKAFHHANGQAQFIANTAGKKSGVLLLMKQYEKMLEDLHDLVTIAARREEEPTSVEEVKWHLKQDGLISG